MATVDEVYGEYGKTAEVAQTFEHMLATLLLLIECGLCGWHNVPDSESAQKALDQIEAKTLGGKLTQLRNAVGIDPQIKDRLAKALMYRNKLMHGWFYKHDEAMETNAGREAMVGELRATRTEMGEAWQLSSDMWDLMHQTLTQQKGAKKGE